MKPTSFTRRTPASLTGFFAVVLSVAALLGTPEAAVAQDGAITGHITAITGEDLAGVQVFIPGTSFGTLTDEAGRYRITGCPRAITRFAPASSVTRAPSSPSR